MPVKRKAGRKPKRNMRGTGFFGDLWDGVKSVGSKIVPFVAQNGLLSKGLSLIPHPGAQSAAKLAGAVGLGRKRRVGRPRKAHGRGPISSIASMFGLGAEPQKGAGRGSMKLVGMSPVY